VAAPISASLLATAAPSPARTVELAAETRRLASSLLLANACRSSSPTPVSRNTDSSLASTEPNVSAAKARASPPSSGDAPVLAATTVSAASRSALASATS
jgi:hypothetical protein